MRLLCLLVTLGRRWARAVEAWPDYATYQAKTARQVPVFVLEPMK